MYQRSERRVASKAFNLVNDLCINLVRERETTHDDDGQEQQLQRRRLSRRDPHSVGGFRLRLRGRQPLAASRLVGRARRHQELCRDLLRSGCPHRQRLLALAGGEHPARCDRACARCRQPEGSEAAAAEHCRRAPTSVRRAMAAPARRRAITRTAICSRCSRSASTSLQVTADTSAAVIGFQLHFNTLAKAAIMGLYKRRSA